MKQFANASFSAIESISVRFKNHNVDNSSIDY